MNILKQHVTKSKPFRWICLRISNKQKNAEGVEEGFGTVI
jgi:hypothetical protein